MKTAASLFQSLAGASIVSVDVTDMGCPMSEGQDTRAVTFVLGDGRKVRLMGAVVAQGMDACLEIEILEKKSA